MLIRILKSGLLLAFQNGCKVAPIDVKSSDCRSLAIKSLDSLVANISCKVEILITDSQPLELDLIPLSVLFLIFKIAALVTERVNMGSGVGEGLRRLRILRCFLKAVGKRWLCCGELIPRDKLDTSD